MSCKAREEKSASNSSCEALLSYNTFVIESRQIEAKECSVMSMSSPPEVPTWISPESTKFITFLVMSKMSAYCSLPTRLWAWTRVPFSKEETLFEDFFKKSWMPLTSRSYILCSMNLSIAKINYSGLFRMSTGKKSVAVPSYRLSILERSRVWNSKSS
jgi:hypothetical protein